MKRSCMVITCFVFILAGCATVGNKTGFLSNYDGLKKGTYLEGIHADTASIQAGGYQLIAVAPINIQRAADIKDLTAVEAAASFRKDLQNATTSAGTAKYFTFDTAASAPSVPVLEIAITEINPGSHMTRYFIGEVAGHAFVQAEGRVVDPATNKELMTFSERRRSTGALGWRDSLVNDPTPSLIKEALRDLSKDIIREVGEVFKFSPEPGAEWKRK